MKTDVEISESVVQKLLSVSDLLQIRLQRALRKHDLTLSQYQILKILNDAGEPLPCLEIASRTITVTPGITGLIDRLENAGLVRRRRCNKDRRVIFVELTDDANELVDRLDSPLHELYLVLHEALTKNELNQLKNCLSKLTQSLG